MQRERKASAYACTEYEAGVHELRAWVTVVRSAIKDRAASLDSGGASQVFSKSCRILR